MVHIYEYLAYKAGLLVLIIEGFIVMGCDKLLEIIKQSRAEAEEEKHKSITSCPECSFVPLQKNKEGKLSCAICGWTSRLGK